MTFLLCAQDLSSPSPTGTPERLVGALGWDAEDAAVPSVTPVLVEMVAFVPSVPASLQTHLGDGL